MNRKHRTRTADSHSKLMQRKQKHERLFERSVNFIHPLPSYAQLRREACVYHGTETLRPNQVIAYARHTYTNYDSLCRRLRSARFLAKEICEKYHKEANDLIYQTLRQEREEA